MQSLDEEHVILLQFEFIALKHTGTFFPNDEEEKNFLTGGARA